MTAIYGNMMEGTRQTSNESTGQIQSKTIECVAFFFYAEGAKGDNFILNNKCRYVVFENVWKTLIKLCESVQ